MKKFIDALKSFLKYVDDGKFFRNPMKWLYAIFAVLNIAAPIYLIIKVLDANMFDFMGGWEIVQFLIAWLVLLVGFFFLGMFWWLRKDQITEHAETVAEFPATPVFAHLLRTVGEWLGMLTGGVMFVVMLLLYILAGFKSGGTESMFSELMPLGGGGGLVNIIMMPVVGFITILVFRFFSEMCRVRVIIAKNTNK